MGDFASAHLKIKRANKHIADVGAIVRSLPDAYVVTIVRDDKTGHQAIKYELAGAEVIVIDLALIIGDAIHNLRTALEYAWIAAIKRLVPSAFDKYTKFPVYDTREKLESALKGREININSPALFKRIVSDIQPFRGGNNDFICSLHDIDVSDKHLLLIPLMHGVGITGIVLQHKKTGEIEKGSSFPAEGSGPHFILLEDHWDIKEMGKVATAVLFNDGSTIQGTDVSDMLDTLSIQVLNVVQLLENL